MNYDGLANYWGPLGDDVRQRIKALLDNPCHATWDAAHGIILRNDPGFGLGLTLWQAWCAVDDHAPRSGPVYDEYGTMLEPWTRVPDTLAVARAIRYARTVQAPSSGKYRWQ